MRAKSGSENRKRSSTITARVEPEVREAVKTAAGLMSDSDWLRAVVIESLKLTVPKSEHQRRAPKKLSAHENGELGVLARSLAQATGMLKLSAQTFRQSDDQLLHASAEAVLSEMSNAAKRVIFLLDEQQK